MKRFKVLRIHSLQIISLIRYNHPKIWEQVWGWKCPKACSLELRVKTKKHQPITFLYCSELRPWEWVEEASIGKTFHWALAASFAYPNDGLRQPFRVPNLFEKPRWWKLARLFHQYSCRSGLSTDKDHYEIRTAHLPWIHCKSHLNNG